MFQLTEEDRRQCRIYRQQAIAVEKRLQENREKRLNERRELELAEEELLQENDVTDDCNSSSSAIEVMDFIRQVFRNSNDLDEVKHLISQVGEELQKRRSEESRDSTSNDVDSISFNQNLDSCNFGAESNYFDRKSDGMSIIHADDSDIVYNINEPNTSKSENNISSIPLYLKTRSELMAELNNTEMFLDSQINTSSVHSCESEIVTPPKLIRRTSYTLEFPSPSVIASLRSMTLGNCNEKSEDSGNDVKNLNNYSEEVPPRSDLSQQIFSELDDGNENLKSLECNNLDCKPNGYDTDLENEGEVEEIEENNESNEEMVRNIRIFYKK